LGEGGKGRASCPRKTYEKGPRERRKKKQLHGKGFRRRKEKKRKKNYDARAGRPDGEKGPLPIRKKEDICRLARGGGTSVIKRKKPFCERGLVVRRAGGLWRRGGKKFGGEKLSRFPKKKKKRGGPRAKRRSNSVSKPPSKRRGKESISRWVVK